MLEQVLFLGTLNPKVDKRTLKKGMTSSSVGTYLRFLRRKSGLSQRELARILGTVSASQISRHERSRILPSILTAFGYQVVFQKPASDIFPGLYHAVKAVVEERLGEFKRDLDNSTPKRQAALPALWDMERIREEEDHESA